MCGTVTANTRRVSGCVNPKNVIGRVQTGRGYTGLFFLVLLLWMPLPGQASEAAATAEAPPVNSGSDAEARYQAEVDQLQEPLYNPFVERYVLDELKQLRTEMAANRAEMIQQVADRQMVAVNTAVRYSTDTVTYFFYLIAGVSSVLVVLGWSSIRDIKERVHSLADEQVSNLVAEYEERLQSIEHKLNQKTLHIEENREEIELTRELQSLWLRAAQENNSANKISIYDQILKLSPNDSDALSYKADSVLEMGEPQSAANLCRQALDIDPDNTHAFYQLACAYAAMGQPEDAMRYLNEVVTRTDIYKEEIIRDPALTPLHDYQPFRERFGVV